ncbi:MAG: hypothetical protein M1812_002682 [Candelaria pacifica]|nr:MAG: hypothetical protein M1812_002682 [Candelaria pacifica]
MRAALIFSVFLATLAATAPVAQDQDQDQDQEGLQEYDWKPTLAGNHQPTTSVNGTDTSDGDDTANALGTANKAAAKVNDPNNAKVTNKNAFDSGAGNRKNDNTKDGIGAGKDVYKYYKGPAKNFPDNKNWVSFENMFNNYKPVMKKGCGNNNWGPEDTDAQINDIHDAIQTVAKDSLVDHRFILAVVMQESLGCVHVPTTNNGVKNPGLMQSHNGADYNPNNSKASIVQMIRDGTQGTNSGDGLVQGINQSGNVYAAARIYNSGSIAKDGNLSNGNGATACYVSDIANRLTGWVNAKTNCPK